MSKLSVSLGTADSLLRLFSYPNKAGSTEPLQETMLHWLAQTLERDGFAARGADAAIRLEGSEYILDLHGPAEMVGYSERIPKFLSDGGDALKVVDELKKPTSKTEKAWPHWVNSTEPNKIWDPQGTGRWRF
ncbi:MAG: hypothetical protein O7D32_06485, partial [bacterium]|nr:hypothetical protein [bacterium]